MRLLQCDRCSRTTSPDDVDGWGELSMVPLNQLAGGGGPATATDPRWRVCPECQSEEERSKLLVATHCRQAKIEAEAAFDELRRATGVTKETA
jgi:hypothetical protein